MRSLFEWVAENKLPSISNLVQVGSNWGDELEMFVANNVEIALLIEPLQKPYEILANRISEIKKYKAIQILVGARDDEEKDFYIASNFGASSSILAPSGHRDIFPEVNFENKLRLQSQTLDTIIKKSYGATGISIPKFDALYMDVQGAELEVLKGACGTLENINYIYTEVGFGGGYKGDVSVDKLISFLDIFGFKVSELEIEPNSTYGNAIFYKTKKNE